METNTTDQSVEGMYSANTQTDPLHQYANVVPPSQPVAAPMYNQQYPATYPINTPVVASNVTSQAYAAGVLGLIVVSTGTLGANLHRVQDGDMSMTDAVANSLAKGAAGGVAAAGATAVAASFTAGGALGLAVTLAVGTGVSYLLNK
ncbi:MAG: hypothetical protein COA36_09630 [Desulfotalea sp.]|nr:MAG: hypothetical protein COA36_09630 [Desulfotalea sp.]